MEIVHISNKVKIPGIDFVSIPSKDDNPSVSQKKTSKSFSKFIFKSCLFINSEAFIGP